MLDLIVLTSLPHLVGLLFRFFLCLLLLLFLVLLRLGRRLLGLHALLGRFLLNLGLFLLHLLCRRHCLLLLGLATWAAHLDLAQFQLTRALLELRSRLNGEVDQALVLTLSEGIVPNGEGGLGGEHAGHFALIFRRCLAHH